MRRILVLVVLGLFVMGVSPASAGTADNPEITDACGLEETEPDQRTVPWTDICAGWLSVSGSTVTATLQFAGDVTERPAASNYGVTWTTDDGCTHGVGMGDPSAASDLPIMGGTDGYVVFSAVCPIPEVCDRYGCYDTEHRAYEHLPADAVVESGSTLTFTIPLTGGLAALTDQYERGDTLRGPQAETGIDCVLCLIYSDATAPGRDYVIS